MLTGSDTRRAILDVDVVEGYSVLVIRQSDGTMGPISDDNPYAQLIAEAPLLKKQVDELTAQVAELERKRLEVREYFASYFLLVSTMRKAQRTEGLDASFREMLEGLVDGHSSREQLTRFFGPMPETKR